MLVGLARLTYRPRANRWPPGWRTGNDVQEHQRWDPISSWPTLTNGAGRQRGRGHPGTAAAHSGALNRSRPTPKVRPGRLRRPGRGASHPYTPLSVINDAKNGSHRSGNGIDLERGSESSCSRRRDRATMLLSSDGGERPADPPVRRLTRWTSGSGRGQPYIRRPCGRAALHCSTVCRRSYGEDPRVLCCSVRRGGRGGRGCTPLGSLCSSDQRGLP